MGQSDEGLFGLLPLIIIFVAQTYVVYQVCKSSVAMPIKVCWTIIVLLFPFVGVCAWACCGPYETGGGRIQHSLSQRYGWPGPESGPFAASRPQPQAYAQTYGGSPQYGPPRPGEGHATSGYDEEYGRQPAFAPGGEPPVAVEETKQAETYPYGYGKQQPLAVAHRLE